MKLLKEYYFTEELLKTSQKKNELLWPLAFTNFVQQKRHDSLSLLHFFLSIKFLVVFQNKKILQRHFCI